MLPYRILLLCLGLALLGPAHAQDVAAPQQPAWRVLEFEEKALWATASARIVVPNRPAGSQQWQLSAEGAIENTYERVTMQFDPVTAQLSSRLRMSKGRKEQRMKTWDYQEDFIVRKRQNPNDSTLDNPGQWPVTNARRLYYPPGAADLPITSDYLLLLLADRLRAQGPGATRDVLVHTDLNFFRVRLTVAPGKPVEADYRLESGEQVRGKRDTVAVLIKFRPEGKLREKADFSLLGLYGEITVYFDTATGLPLLLHGDAPTLGTAQIHLRQVEMRRPPR